MTPPMIKDQWHKHDPSHIVETDGVLMIALTGKEKADGYKFVIFYCYMTYPTLPSCGLETWYLSPGQADWQPGQCLFTSKPSWVQEEQ